MKGHVPVHLATGQLLLIKKKIENCEALLLTAALQCDLHRFPSLLLWRRKERKKVPRSLCGRFFSSSSSSFAKNWLPSRRVVHLLVPFRWQRRPIGVGLPLGWGWVDRWWRTQKETKTPSQVAAPPFVRVLLPVPHSSSPHFALGRCTVQLCWATFDFSPRLSSPSARSRLINIPETYCVCERERVCVSDGDCV